ncbi:MAG: hypothetical protein Ct9H300mP28_22950 [Pseudomonadota bacterium]|nr:MAG: hypothetical protein Ct9H300mP28_22950 [Pseudomonadota bacterium]
MIGCFFLFSQQFTVVIFVAESIIDEKRQPFFGELGQNFFLVFKFYTKFKLKKGEKYVQKLKKFKLLASFSP